MLDQQKALLFRPLLHFRWRSDRLALVAIVVELHTDLEERSRNKVLVALTVDTKSTNFSGMALKELQHRLKLDKQVLAMELLLDMLVPATVLDMLVDCTLLLIVNFYYQFVLLSLRFVVPLFVLCCVLPVVVVHVVDV